MKRSPLRTLPVAALFFVAVLAGAPDAHAQLGIAGGVNFDSIGDVQDGDRDLNFDNSTGYHIGAFYDFAVGPLGVRPGVYYMDVGSFSGEGNSAGEFPQQVREDFDLSLVEVPIDLRYRLATPFIKPYVTAGPVFRFNVSEDSGLGDASSDFSVAGNAGLGVDFGLPASNLALFLEGRYSFGLSPIAEDFEAGGAEFTVQDDTRLNNFMLRLGLRF